MTFKSIGKKVLLLIIPLFLCSLSACMYVTPVTQGKAISDRQIASLKLKMSQAEIKKRIGMPFLPQGNHAKQWTYLHYAYNNEKVNKQYLILSFDRKGRLIKVEKKT